MRKVLVFRAIAIGAFVGVSMLAIHPGQAVALIAQATESFKCATPTPCLSATNTKSGSAIGASSNTGTAITATSKRLDGVDAATSATEPKGAAGVAGFDDSHVGNIGVLGYSTYGNGMEAESQFGFGLYGVSDASDGVEGITAGSIGSASGVVGIDQSKNVGTNVGVEGISYDGHAVLGLSSAGSAIFGQSSSIGLIAFSTGNGTAVIANNVASGTGLQAVAGSGPVLIGTNGPNNQDILSVDSSGNEILAGTLTASGQPTIRTKTSSGRIVAAYADRTSKPSVEDLGEAQLSNGEAYVALESTFAATIDQRAKYMVFLQPQGDNRGLYVTAISARGFAVRESNGGHSTLDFDYRIVAKPYDSNAGRLAVTTAFSGLAHEHRLPSAIPQKQFMAALNRRRVRSRGSALR